MRSKFMQARAEEKRRKRLEQEKASEILKEISSMISLNKSDLEVEIARISNLLNMIEEVVVKYDEKNQKMVYWHIKEMKEEFDSCMLIKMLASQLQKISDDAVFEFFGEVNIFNFVEEISNKVYKLERIMLVWKAQSVIKNIKYQFERIWNSDNKAYQVAVLKGMIALC